MQVKLYQDLEYDKIIACIQNGCHSEAGKEEAAKISPLTDLKAIRTKQNLLAEIQEALKNNQDFDFTNLLPLTELFAENKQSVYAYEEFRLAYLNAQLAMELCKRREEFGGCSELYKLLKKLYPLPTIVQRFEQIFEEDGEVKDTASEALKRLRRKKNLLREQIIRSLEKKFTESSFQSALQEKYVTQRDGRYVVPIKESHVPQIKGIVQGQSGSKATVFMEPEDVVSSNNDLQLLQQEEKREIFRIFQAFTDEIHEIKDKLTENYSLLAELDCLFSCGRLGVKLQSRVPEIIPEPMLQIKGGRHPLLILQKGAVHKVVPFDLNLGDEYDFLVLSGPNTGGKTVLLKAVGLLTLMALSGLPIPAADGTKIGQFEQVAAEIGDAQSIEEALSSFSSHISKLKAILEVCNERTLVLLDEIGAATDPQQGSALAQAIMESLAAKQAKGIATTHYIALKVFAEGKERFSNASMQFDLKSLTPTYKFELGFPGDSFAIEVAASLGLESSLVNRARQLTGTQNMEFTELIKKVQEERKQLATVSWQVELRQRNLEAKIKEYEQRIKQFDEELKLKRKELLKEQQQELIQSQKQLLREMEDLKNVSSEQRKKKTEELAEKMQTLQRVTREEIKSLEPDQDRPVTDPQSGEIVWLTNFETEATVVERKGQTVLVDMNGIRFKTELSNLRASQIDKTEATAPSVKVKAAPSAQFELKLLGLTFDEAKPLIDEFIDNAYLAGLHSLRIVHGKGTGALRTKVRAYLKTKKQVLTIATPPQSAGGNGVTVITI